MVQVVDDKIVQFSLPRTGYLKDGSSVSGYDILMRSDLELAKEEGWLPLEEEIPKYDGELQYLITDGYEILEDKVIKKYRVEDIPKPQPSELDLLGQEIADIKLQMIIGGM